MTRRGSRYNKSSTKNIISLMVLLFIIIVLFFIFRSCSFSPKPSATSTINNTVFIVLAPIEKDKSEKSQLNLAITFVKNAESSLMLKGNYYELKGICSHDLEYIESLHYSKFNSAQSLFDSLLNWLRKTQDQICDSSPKESLKSVINRINDYLNQNENKYLIAFIQIPWKNGFSPKEYDELTLEVGKIKDKNRVKKIYLFGVSDGNISKVFHDLNLAKSETVVTYGTYPGNIKESIGQARELIRSSK